jgi:hypothetical protein
MTIARPPPQMHNGVGQDDANATVASSAHQGITAERQSRPGAGSLPADLIYRPAAAARPLQRL